MSALAFSLVFLGLLLVIGEMFVTTGILALAGLIAFAIGAVLLWELGFYVYSFFWPQVIGEALLIVILLVITGVLFIKSRARPVVTGSEQLLGGEGEIVRIENDQVLMRLQGEIWQAKADGPVTVGQKVVVTAREGMVLYVRPL